ncbi:hypothetical protein GCM10027020_03170 [Nocardioides salsibiostraticola]
MTLLGGVTVVADAAATVALAPLLEVWEGCGRLRVERSGLPEADVLRSLADASDAILLVGPRNRSPRTVLEGPVVEASDGRIVPVGWLPNTGPEDLATFARAAVRVHARAAAPPAQARRTFAVLAERHPRFDRLADRVARLAREDPLLHAPRWTAYEVDREELSRRIASGPALAVYVGHGRPIGWVGYAGLRIHHFQQAEPAAAVVSLTCKTASRRRTGLSFAEGLALRGIAAAALGAVGPTLHSANARWAVRLARLTATAATIGDLVVAIAPHDPGASAYRLIGDPTAPLLDSPAMSAFGAHESEAS